MDLIQLALLSYSLLDPTLLPLRYERLEVRVVHVVTSSFTRYYAAVSFQFYVVLNFFMVF